MKVLFYDTETSGFNPPAIIQIWIIIWELSEDWAFVVENTIERLFNPQVKIDQSASKIHWFTDDQVKDYDKFWSFISEFTWLIKSCDFVIWHNIWFDNKAFVYEIRRFFDQKNEKLSQKAIDFIQEFEDKSICTILQTIDFCKIPGPYWYKWPKLQELHFNLFGENFEDAHDAISDIKATTRCFLELIKRWIIDKKVVFKNK